jgi:hypothetical protein
MLPVASLKIKDDGGVKWIQGMRQASFLICPDVVFTLADGVDR